MILLKNSMKNLLLTLFLIPFIVLGQDCVEPKLPDWDKKTIHLYWRLRYFRNRVFFN